MQTEAERERVLAQQGPTREFRVSRVERYQVTEWNDYRGGAGTRVIVENVTRDRANEIARVYGRAYPDALVNEIGPSADDGSVCMLMFSMEAMAAADRLLAAHGIEGGVLSLVRLRTEAAPQIN